MANKLILIRHGETVWNYKKRYCGHNDIGLSKKGMAQAKKLRNRIKEEIIHKVYTSDRRRAIQTAKIIFNGSKQLKQIPDLAEINFGCFEGLTHRQILKKYPEIYKKWLKDPYNNHVPEGEKLTDFKKRIISSIKKIVCGNPSETVAVVCHGGAISAFITHILRKRDFWKHIPHSASLTIIEYERNKPKIKLLNDTAHLA
ncbi:MAG: histidine phosphatase family protein [Candidatus Omnitrophota bacterium]|nr:histidine phosphatase family protein [Candidatus Omnitrophota bacterium]